MVMPFVVQAQSDTSTDTSKVDSIDWDLLLQDVVVTATYAPTRSQDAIHEIRVLDRVDIEQLQARNLKELLIADASVRLQEDRLLGSKTSLLGLDGQNVKIMIDGVPVIGRLDGNIDISQINMNDVAQVEIVEGPLSVNYGTDALAGVINIITKKSQLDRFQLQLNSTGETKGENTVNASIGLRPTDKWYVSLQGGYDDFDGFSTDTTRQLLWKPKVQKYGGVVLRFLPNDKHDIKYTYNYMDEEVLNEGDIRRPQFKPYAFDEAYNTIRKDHVIHYDGNFGKGWYLRGFAAYNAFDRTVDSWRVNFLESEDEKIPLVDQQDTNQIVSVNERVTLSYQPLKGKFHFQTGIDSRYDQNKGERIISPDDSLSQDASIFDNAFFGSARFVPNKHVTIEGGVRYALNNRFKTKPIPSLNLRYQLNENWTFRGSYGQGFRSPDIKELYFNFIDVNHFIVGNPDLTPEQSHNVQMGITYFRAFRGQEVTFGLKGFYNDISDKIELFEYVELPDGSITPAIDTLTNTYSYFNLDRFKSLGLSSRFGYDAFRWRIRVGYTLVGRYNPGLSELNNRYAFNNEISLSARYVIPVIDMALASRIRYYDRKIDYYPDVDEDGNEFLGERNEWGYTDIDVFASRSFWDERIGLTMGVRNLLDVTSTRVTGSGNSAHTTQEFQRVVSTGRRYFVSMSFKLAWD